MIIIILNGKLLCMDLKILHIKMGYSLYSLYFLQIIHCISPNLNFWIKFYHLNVDPKNSDSFGHISLNHINEWRICGKVASRPTYGVKQALFDIFCLFLSQGIESAYDDDMVNKFMNKRELFNEEAKKWTFKYAIPFWLLMQIIIKVFILKIM